MTWSTGSLQIKHSNLLAFLNVKMFVTVHVKTRTYHGDNHCITLKIWSVWLCQWCGRNMMIYRWYNYQHQWSNSTTRSSITKNQIFYNWVWYIDNINEGTKRICCTPLISPTPTSKDIIMHQLKPFRWYIYPGAKQVDGMNDMYDDNKSPHNLLGRWDWN